MNKLTKIVATIGPASESEEMIEKLMLAGVNIFRFNLKHNDIIWHSSRIDRVNTIAQKLGKTIGNLVDLQGPEVRIFMAVDSIDVSVGEKILITAKAVEPEFVEIMKNGGTKGFSISHLDILPYLQTGQKVVADDGVFIFHVEKQGEEIYLVSESAGTLKTRKTLNIPGADFPLPVLVQRDFDALAMAGTMKVDFIALSFVRSAADIESVRAEMAKHNVQAKIVAKIETQRALDNIDEIISATDGVMVARGDLAVEAAIEEVPYHQKKMIRKCMHAGKFVITATQMLLSMTKNAYPTRAEVSDIANAVYDETDAVMLSEESAAGAYPLEAVSMMSKILSFHDYKHLNETDKVFEFSINDTSSLVCDAAYELYYEYIRSSQKIAGFLVFTQTGRTAQLLSRYRARVPIYVFTPDQGTCERLSINFGVFPFKRDVNQSQEVTRAEVKEVSDFLIQQNHVESGSKLIVMHGDYWGVHGGTSTVRIIEV